jgi:DNA-binding MarR family transcriptional regulator
MPKKETERVLNKLLVQLFGDILKIEEKSLQEGEFSDISLTEIHIIEVIGVDKGRTMSEVANDLSVTVGTLTIAINRLIKKEYVERKRTEEDKRVVLINLTEKGKLAYEQHAKFHDEMIKSAISGISIDEELVLISSLDKITRFFEEKYHLIKK